MIRIKKPELDARSLHDPESSSLQEWDVHCRQLIFDHCTWLRKNAGLRCKDPCVFGDLEGCIPLGTYQPQDSFRIKFHKVDAAPIFLTQHCYTHNAQCHFRCADLEMAGLPCWDYSMAGKRLQENGPTIGAFLSHAKRHVHLQTPLVIVENVKESRVFSEKGLCSNNF